MKQKEKGDFNFLYLPINRTFAALFYKIKIKRNYE